MLRVVGGGSGRLSPRRCWCRCSPGSRPGPPAPAQSAAGTGSWPAAAGWAECCGIHDQCQVCDSRDICRIIYLESLEFSGDCACCWWWRWCGWRWCGWWWLPLKDEHWTLLRICFLEMVLYRLVSSSLVSRMAEGRICPLSALPLLPAGCWKLFSRLPAWSLGRSSHNVSVYPFLHSCVPLTLTCPCPARSR